MSFGLALSTGHESLGEYIDITLRPEVDVDLDGLPALLDPVLPEGISVQAAVAVERGGDSLQAAVTSCSWRIEIPSVNPDELATAVEQAEAATTLPVTRQRKGKEVTDDVRPAILSLAIVGPTTRGCELDADLATQPRACRTAELLLVLDARYEEGRVTRIHQWTQVDGERREPIALAPLSTGYAGMRAS